jgi:predicted Co/Zn/Cd cation transporter (cation efflux family)
MLDAETKGTIIDGTMSAGIGIVAIVIAGITPNSPLAFLLYTGDFFITIVLCVFTIKEPLSVIKKSFIELTGGVLIDKNIQASFENIISEYLPKTIILNKCRIYKVGMSLHAEIEVNTSNNEINPVELLDSKKEITRQLSKEFEFVQIDLKF